MLKVGDLMTLTFHKNHSLSKENFVTMILDVSVIILYIIEQETAYDGADGSLKRKGSTENPAGDGNHWSDG